MQTSYKSSKNEIKIRSTDNTTLLYLSCAILENVRSSWNLVRRLLELFCDSVSVGTSLAQVLSEDVKIDGVPPGADIVNPRVERR